MNPQQDAFVLEDMSRLVRGDIHMHEQPIHPIFRLTNWDPSFFLTSSITRCVHCYNHKVLAILKLASIVLTSEDSLHFLYTLLCNPRVPVPGQTRMAIDLSHLPRDPALREFQENFTLRTLERLADMDLTKFPGRKSRIFLKETESAFLSTCKNFQCDRPTSSALAEELRVSMLLVLTLLHEVTHALQYAALEEGSVVHEAYYGDSPIAELGWEYQNAVFGGVVYQYFLKKPVNYSLQTADLFIHRNAKWPRWALMFSTWPDPIIAHLYRQKSHAMGHRKELSPFAARTRIFYRDVQPFFTRAFHDAHGRRPNAALQLSAGPRAWRLRGFADFFLGQDPFQGPIYQVPSGPELRWTIHGRPNHCNISFDLCYSKGRLAGESQEQNDERNAREDKVMMNLWAMLHSDWLVDTRDEDIPNPLVSFL